MATAILLKAELKHVPAHDLHHTVATVLVERFRRWETPAARAGQVVDEVIRERRRPLFAQSWQKALIDVRECTDAKCRCRAHAASYQGWEEGEDEIEDEGKKRRKERPCCLKPSCWEDPPGSLQAIRVAV